MPFWGGFHMNEYLLSIEYAVQGIVELINADKRRIKILNEQIQEKEKDSDSKWLEIMDLENSEEDIYDLKMDAILKLYERDEIKVEVKGLISELKGKKDSINILSGTLLQFAKQSISSVYGNPYDISCHSDKTKSGEIIKVGGTKLFWDNPYRNAREELRVLDLILASRNQFEHYEEGINDNPRETSAGSGVYRSGTLSQSRLHNINIFKELNNVRPTLYDCILSSEIKNGVKQPKNFAGNVVNRLLKWDSVQKFNDHLLSINK